MEAVPSNCTGRDLVGHVAEVRSQLTWTGNAKRHLAITERRHKALKITHETRLVEVEYAFVDTAPVRLLEFNLTDQAVDI